MPDATFLETFPLYRRFAAGVPSTLNHIAKPPVSMLCGNCKQGRTFRMINEYYHGFSYSNFPSSGEVIKVTYKCSYCLNFNLDFYIKIADDRLSISKVGQFPPWKMTGDKNIQAMLGSHKDLLQKGIVCESQSYGVGAFAYYRRIVEEIIDSLLDDIGELLSPDENERYASALASTKRTRVTADKIELVKDLLPSVLRPDNMNPLALLHGVLSEGLHADSDDRCLELAVEVREILTFLASQVAASKVAAHAFTDRMRSLLNKREKDISAPSDDRPKLI